MVFLTNFPTGLVVLFETGSIILSEIVSETVSLICADLSFSFLLLILTEVSTYLEGLPSR